MTDLKIGDKVKLKHDFPDLPKEWKVTRTRVPSTSHNREQEVILRADNGSTMGWFPASVFVKEED